MNKMALHGLTIWGNRAVICTASSSASAGGAYQRNFHRSTSLIPAGADDAVGPDSVSSFGSFRRRNVPLTWVVFGRSRSYNTDSDGRGRRGQRGQNKGQSADGPEEEFRTLEIYKSKNVRFQRWKRREKKEVAPPRYLKMPVDQDWPSVWPTARTFHPASVPLPLHQGFVPPNRAPPGKFGNLELMKISNFLHLTPPAIKRHCEALKKFCTPWPEELKDDYVLEKLFPIEVTTNDYCHSSPSIRDIRTRIVTLQIPVSVLKLDYHAKDKLLRLVGERYDVESDILTLVTDCCPLKKQNRDYAMYLLTALYHESWNQEKWEDEKGAEDFEKYIWEGSISQKTVKEIVSSFGEGNAALAPILEQYRTTVEVLHNEGEDVSAVEEYGASVRKLLNLPMSSA